ncbi:SGNH/GDSL hydrolase family protein [Oryzobacter telluris]|uniref:SGNH/GDSL hydrolase family protein n=1 Tax=Oryzobacter telluris TaxID=3149179 RepID=UPI00370DCD8D
MAQTARLAALGTALLLITACSSPGGSPATTAPTTATPSAAPLSLVVIGDSIPYNSQQDCPGCRGFVTRYAEALGKATGRVVDAKNRSEHTGLTLPGLMKSLPSLRTELSGADAIIVAIAHNSSPLSSEAPCGSGFDEAASTLEDWSKVDAACADAGAAEFRPVYDELYATVAGWRSGRPTILLTVNKYNDWIGWEQAHLTADQEQRTTVVHDAWNTMLCASATQHGFDCIDLYHAFNGADGSTASGDLVAADYTHPSQKGNDLIARLLTERGYAPLR